MRIGQLEVQGPKSPRKLILRKLMLGPSLDVHTTVRLVFASLFRLSLIGVLHKGAAAGTACLAMAAVQWCLSQQC